ncbi:hypothetical protein ACTJIJ_08915 [Niabella sp. 22666]|uniref:hypothetical protein n=1 Tax=Niabella sp. 22666 TaxID=3453954 RepID=UPI003F86C8FC
MIKHQIILEGSALWSYDYEIVETGDRYIGFSLIGGIPHHHKGDIVLADGGIITITGDENIKIPLSSIREIYLGFDEVYKNIYVKNFGIFWQPLRIQYYITTNRLGTIYLVVDYGGMFNKNNKWYETITNILS